MNTEHFTPLPVPEPGPPNDEGAAPCTAAPADVPGATWPARESAGVDRPDQATAGRQADATAGDAFDDSEPILAPIPSALTSPALASWLERSAREEFAGTEPWMGPPHAPGPMGGNASAPLPSRRPPAAADRLPAPQAAGQAAPTGGYPRLHDRQAGRPTQAPPIGATYPPPQTSVPQEFPSPYAPPGGAATGWGVPPGPQPASGWGMPSAQSPSVGTPAGGTSPQQATGAPTRDAWSAVALPAGLLLGPIGTAIGVAGIVRTAKGRRAGRWMAVAGAVLGLLGTVAAVVWLLPLLGGPDTDPLAADVTRPTTANAVQLTKGNCIETLPKGGEVTSVRVVPCSHRHDAQVVDATTFNGNFPGEAEAYQSVAATCTTDRFGSVDGLHMVVWTPTKTSWSSGDRTGLCIAVNDRGLGTDLAAG